MIKKILLKITPAVSLYHFLLSFLGSVIYRFPSKKIKVIGVTGTNGKSTTVYLITAILREAGYSVASTSSVSFDINGNKEENLLKMTMPGRMKIQRFLRQAVNNGCTHAVLEVSSEGIKQHRHRFINFHTSVITNLSKEHIEAHGGFKNYKKAKGKLFSSTKNIHIINLDDKNSEYFFSFSAKKKITYAVEQKNADIVGSNVQSNNNGVSFVCENESFFLPFKGRFNVYNALCALSVASSEEISFNIVKKVFSEAIPVPGRMEEVISTPYKVFVDYAVTPDTLKEVYGTLKKDFSPQKMICVLGSCGGGRDKWKRPVMGEVAGALCDKVIITNEDPYNENPLQIIDDVASGVPKAEKILDRRKAIKKAVASAKKGDVVIITGKGCEKWMCVSGGKKIPWDDCKIVKEVI